MEYAKDGGYEGWGDPLKGVPVKEYVNVLKEVYVQVFRRLKGVFRTKGVFREVLRVYVTEYTFSTQGALAPQKHSIWAYFRLCGHQGQSSYVIAHPTD